MTEFLENSLRNITWYVLVILAGALLYLLGNLVFGWKQEGGKRLILFVIGAGTLWLAEGARFYLWPAFADQQYPKALGMVVPLCFFPFGGGSVIVSLFCHNDWVRFAFAAILRGL